MVLTSGAFAFPGASTVHPELRLPKAVSNRFSADLEVVGGSSSVEVHTTAIQVDSSSGAHSLGNATQTATWVNSA